MENADNSPMIHNEALTEAGVLPFKIGPVRFAVGSPTGSSSNAWKIWTSKAGDVYIACRDNLKEAKVSLHASGRWRMGFTTEAISKDPNLRNSDENRAWEVWDKPPQTLPDLVVAFQLIFPTAELAVVSDQRPPSEWKKVAFIEAAPVGKLTILTLFITNGSPILKHGSEPSFTLASLDIGNGLFAQLVAHGDPEGEWPELINQCVLEAKKQTEAKGIDVPKDGYGYFYGHRENGSRFLVGARFHRP